MELSETQKLLINGLKLFKMEKEEIIIIMILLQEEDQMNSLMHFMINHREANQEDILEEAVNIAAK